MGCATANYFLAPLPGALGRGQKAKYLISITKSISKTFIPNFACVLTYERYKTYQIGFSFYHLCPGGGGGGGQKNFKHGHVAFQFEKDDEQNRTQVKFSP